jgi:hypothetical protein
LLSSRWAVSAKLSWPSAASLFEFFKCHGESDTRKEWVEVKRLAGSARFSASRSTGCRTQAIRKAPPTRHWRFAIHRNGPLGLSDPYPLGIGIQRIDDGRTPKDYERGSSLSSRKALPNPEQISNRRALVRVACEATAPARHASRRASIARRSLPDRTPM